MTPTEAHNHPAHPTHDMNASTVVLNIPIRQIDRARNHRIAQAGDEERIAALMESINVAGQLQPIRVYELDDVDQAASGCAYTLGFGDRRCTAMERLGHAAILAVVFPPASDADIEQARSIENLHRQDISPMEEVLAVSHMLDALKKSPSLPGASLPGAGLPGAGGGDIYSEVADRLGRSVRWVRDRDYLHRLSPKCQELALRAQVPAGHLREIAKVGDTELQFALVCDAAGAFRHWFDSKSQTLKPCLKGYAKDIEEFFAHVAEGSVRRLTLKEIEQRVAEAQKSLRMAAWHFDLPVAPAPGSKTGGKTLPACSGCEHNSETDRTLFGVAEDPANPRGVCMKPSCFAAKQTAVEGEKAALLKSLARRQKQPTVEEVDAMTPDWLKPSVARGFVQREWKKKNQPQAKGNGDSKSAGRGFNNSGSRALNPLEQAIERFNKTLDQWCIDASDQVIGALMDRPLSWAAYCALMHSNLWSEGGNSWEFPYINSWNKPVEQEPAPPKDPDMDLLELIRQLGQPTLALFQQIGALEANEETDDLDFLRYRHHGVIQAVAQALKLDIEEPPAWDQFKPAPPGSAAEPQAASTEPAPSKGGRVPKKVAKKTAKKKGGAA
jgi:ParB/RepB/Spo0J family partition protein